MQLQIITELMVDNTQTAWRLHKPTLGKQAKRYMKVQEHSIFLILNKLGNSLVHRFKKFIKQMYWNLKYVVSVSVL
jgi:hypothetical protein